MEETLPTLSPARLSQVREKIEAAALRCFVEQGFHGTTTREIARKAGVSTGALYAHYASKDELFTAIIDRYRLIFASSHNPLLHRFATGRFPDDLPELAADIAAVIHTHRDFWLLWYVDVLEFGGRHFADTFLQDMWLDQPHLRSRFDELRRGGRLRVDPRVAFEVIYRNLFNHLIVEILFRGGKGPPAEESVAAIIDISLRGILA